MKQFHEFALGAAIGHLWSDCFASSLQDQLPDVAVPIPKYWMRRLLTGTNSAEVLSETIARQLRIPAETAALRMTRPTRKQSLLSPPERRRNIRGAFRVRPDFDFSGAHVLLVDDTMTTGETANEATRVLNRAGAGRVTVAVMGRAAG